MPDEFASKPSELDSPIRSGFPITPSDDADLPHVSRGMWVGTGGNVTVVLAGDTEPVTLKNIPDGSLIPYFIKKVFATGTNALDLVGHRK